MQKTVGHYSRAQGHWGRAVDYGALPAALGVAVFDKDHCIGALNLVWKADDYTIDHVIGTHLNALRKAASTIGRAFTDAKLMP